MNEQPIIFVSRENAAEVLMQLIQEPRWIFIHEELLVFLEQEENFGLFYTVGIEIPECEWSIIESIFQNDTKVFEVGSEPVSPIFLKFQ